MIEGVAIKRDGKLYIMPRPNRHADIVFKVVSEGTLTYPIGDNEQGFYISGNVFVNRQDAYVHALLCGQIEQGHTLYQDRLSSEDVW